MDYRHLKEKTRVYERCELVTESLCWSKADVVTVFQSNGEWSLEEKPGYRMAGFIHPPDSFSEMGFDKLPIEFFNHQLFDCDPSSAESVRSFVETWGFPFLPLRAMAKDSWSWRYQDEARISHALERTDAIRDLALTLGCKFFDDEERYDDEASEEELEEYGEDYWYHRTAPSYGDYIPTGEEAEYFRDLYSSDNDGICDAISLEEASLSLEILQVSWSQIMDCVKNGSTVHSRYLDAINMGASYPQLLHWRNMYSGAVTEQQHYSLLTAAICNQIIDAFRDSAPWRDCACEGCGITFKRKQGRSAAPTSDSIYCCTACEERQKKRNQRSAAKNRIRHQ